ncbi:MAG: hypothetical protein JKY65_02920 [Planctomycetes bacterium]|nr:hypothetical protein [Planctomycetota bacterium]
MTRLHPIQRRYLTEELVRLRRADERQRFAASQRRGRIDPNPHQIDAVIFALRRIPEGGCILADEVGLGKTIEAGLVLAQLLAEGTQRVLLILPKTLMGQWRDELYTLFGLETREGDLSPEAFMGPGIFLVGREFAGGVRGASLLKTSEPFDLCVIDEAHELFAGIYKRVDGHGDYKEGSKYAQTAQRVRDFLGPTPVLLLTATPIQNSLPELWSLVQYVEQSGTLLGKLPTFKAVFCGGDPRTVDPPQAMELRRRIATVCKRTLRRQAQEFLKKPFVERRAQLFEYTMSPDEKALYNDVTAYLLERDLCAYHGHRKLILIGFHKRMASSYRALAKSLHNVAERLRRMLEQAPPEAIKQATLAFALDLEEEFEDEQGEEETPPTAEKIRAELKRVEDFARRAESLKSDNKAKCLEKVLKLQDERQARGESSGKILIFTESLTTQDYIREVLVNAGLDPGEITLFRGQNTSKEARAALKRWEDEVGRKLAPNNRPSPDIAVRLALVYEFKTRARVMISTEAGAKGLNLQFCDTLVNYDLPWNPQRIEQRIGRCHRYGQERDVTVINFLATDNEAQRLTFEILSRKLDLFGKVLDASDVILHQPSGAPAESLVSAPGIIDFESRMRRIYQQSRTQEDIEVELRNMREEIGEARERFESSLANTADLIQDEFDEDVRRTFQQIQDELPKSLAALDLELDRILVGYLDAIGAPYERRSDKGRVQFVIDPCPRLPAVLVGGTEIVIGHARDLEDVDPLHPGHPLILLGALEEARASTAQPLSVKLKVPDADGPPSSRRGARGRYVVTKTHCQGFEPQERLLVTALLEGDDSPLPDELARVCLELQPEDHPGFDRPLSIPDEDVQAAVSEAVFRDQTEISKGNQDRFERVMDQLERYVEDQLFVLRRDLEAAEVRLGEKQTKQSSALASARRKRAGQEMNRIHARVEKLLTRIDQLEQREDDVYQRGRESAHQKRYAQPETTILLDVEFELK